ncbi:MAG TPA: hypothetical protein VL132_10240 [Planctomycetaceae bacterium]|nr:hypothetical protein [Planctomycetaceae bacterium]
MLTLPAARRSAVERLVFSGLILGGGLLWGRVIAETTTGSAARSATARSGVSSVPGRVAVDIDWRLLNHDLASLAPTGAGADVPRATPGGR